MSSKIKAALEIWDSRSSRTAGDTAYAVYLAMLVTITAIAPVIRAVWIGVTSENAMTSLASSQASIVVALIAAAFWAVALLLGGERGPAILAPFLVHVFMGSVEPRTSIFRRPVLRSSTILTLIIMGVAGFFSCAMLAGGVAELADALTFIGGALAVSVITMVAWLTGQALPKVAAVILGLLAVAVVALIFIPASQAFTPLGWIGELYPVGSANPTALVSMSAFAIISASFVPKLLRTITAKSAMRQALKWESATAFVMSMDFAAITSTYQKRPLRGRELFVVRPDLSHPARFFVRGLLGSLRTPSRLLSGAAVMVLAGLLVGGGHSYAPLWIAGAAAGLLAFIGSGSFTDSTRHAIRVAEAPILYGISKVRFLAYSLIFPLVTMLTLAFLPAGLGAYFVHNPIFSAILSAVALAISILFVRVSTAMKGNMPHALLVPVPTPVGDLSFITQFFWALDGVILSMVGGIAAVYITVAPPLFSGLLLLVLLGMVVRWRALVH